MVENQHPEVIEMRRRFINVDVIDSEEAAEDSSINNGAAYFNEEYGSG